MTQITDLSQQLSGLFRRRDRGQVRWWLAITSEGDKERLLLATTVMGAAPPSSAPWSCYAALCR
ncbi:hypothetical protein LJR034_004077 [Caballeronia sp. LjRoot34]|uniref:hypothetical protein n=1 Tax=Caballeronia sp. LjRoot34 TaxID=3342325 RepID=UPI003ECD5174